MKKRRVGGEGEEEVKKCSYFDLLNRNGDAATNASYCVQPSWGTMISNFAVQIPRPRCSMLIQGIHNLVHVLTKQVKDQTSICPAGSSSPESNSPTELISLSESSSSPASSAASLVAYFETYSGPIC